MVANMNTSILFLHRDRFLSNLKPHSDVFHDMDGNDQHEPHTIKQLFEAARHISGVLSALESSGAPVMTPYSGFSVFVAAHINMYGTIAPMRYPGGLERAENEKSKNLVYLERLSRVWPVGRSWVSPLDKTNCTVCENFTNRIRKVANCPGGQSVLRNSEKLANTCRGRNAKSKTVCTGWKIG
jgi:hypothetical protein